MRRRSTLMLAVSGLATAAALATASCAHPATDRVLEPSGAAGSSSSPAPSTPSSPLSDAGVSPAEPMATAAVPDEAVPDFHLARAPEFGQRVEHHSGTDIFAAAAATGGVGASGPGGAGGGAPMAGAPGTGGKGIFR